MHINFENGAVGNNSVCHIETECSLVKFWIHKTSQELKDINIYTYTHPKTRPTTQTERKRILPTVQYIVYTKKKKRV